MARVLTSPALANLRFSGATENFPLPTSSVQDPKIKAKVNRIKNNFFIDRYLNIQMEARGPVRNHRLKSNYFFVTVQ